MRRLLLCHYDGGDELTVIVPGGARTAFVVPLAAFDRVVELFTGAADDIEQRCEQCDASLPTTMRPGSPGSPSRPSP